MAADSANFPEAKVYLSLGANLGDRAASLRAAINALPSAQFDLSRISSFYETEPVDYLDQPWFLNCVVEGRTRQTPLELLRALRHIESQLGASKAFPKGPRLLDIDILLYADLSVDSPDLQIPHPRMLQRKFVLAPLAEIAPALKHPRWEATAEQLLARCPDRSVVKKVPTG